MSSSDPQARSAKPLFPVAGLGTRFLPATKAMPKEMLTVVDRPVIQHVVDEARAAGIEHLIFVTGRNKGVIEDHFDIAFELDTRLDAGQEDWRRLAELARDLPAAGQASFTRQQAPLGSRSCGVVRARHRRRRAVRGAAARHAASCGKKSCLADMMEAYDAHGGNHIAVLPVPDDQTHQYGIVGVLDAKAKVSQHHARWSRSRSKAPRRRTCTSPAATSCSRRSSICWVSTSGAQGNEIQLTDAMIKLAAMPGQAFHAVRFDGEIYDCGSKLGFLMANVAYALARPELAAPFRAELKKMV